MNLLQLLLAFAALFVTVWAQACPRLPRNLTLTANPRLPDPFTFFNGRKVRNAAQWSCRREEIMELFERLESGILPPKPSSVSGTIYDGGITVKITNRRKTISFNATIKYPEKGRGPFPALITIGRYVSIPIPANVAVIAFENDAFAGQNGQSSRGIGQFYDLHGQNHTASAMTAWAWGVGRLIDALEETSRRHRINVRRIGTTGCSRNGKGALTVGAFEPRIVLTIPQESGTGGAGCWRLADDMMKRGLNVQTARQIVMENVWFSPKFSEVVERVPELPIDHHLLAGLVAPRGLYAIEHSGIDWLGPPSTFGCMATGRKVYEALGVADHMGISSVGDHSHCQFPESQQPELDAFIDKFLFRNSSADTDIVRSDVELGFKEEDWIDWKVPKLTR